MLHPKAAVAHATDGGARVQSVEDHLNGVAELAASFAGCFCDPEWGRLAGRWHDLGKFAADFQTMIRGATGLDADLEDELKDHASRGRVDHSSAGAIHARETCGTLGESLAMVIAGHHCGLDDYAKLKARLTAKRSRLDDARRQEPPLAVLAGASPSLPPYVARHRGHLQAQLPAWELWVRMLFSALVDADSLDTEAFCDPHRHQQRVMATAPADLAARLEKHLASLAARSTGSVAEVRTAVQGSVAQAASLTRGIYTLTVPTGGGKTLASMLFALRHAAVHGQRGVIVVPPYTSIIEQTAAVLRSALGADAVLEHHSAIDPERQTMAGLLAAENWDAPVVVTTAVQFFESLFAASRSRCRKLHNVAQSVVILDEAQTLPPGFLAPILHVLAALVEAYGVTVVLSSATQPALRRRDSFPVGLPDMTELAPEPAALASRLRRVDVEWPASLDRRVPWDEVAAAVAAEPRALAIVHRKDDAHQLVARVDAIARDESAVHLSAAMCPAHRSDALARARASLRGAGEVRLVSTQLVEAGVDIDFPVVFRALAGLDSLAQAAGRCNREGLLARGALRVFHSETSPPAGAPLRGYQVALAMLRVDPSLDLFAPAVHEDFFRRFYADQHTDIASIQALRAGCNFRQVAEKFRLIGDDQASIVVPYGDGPARLEDVRRHGADRERLRALQRFVVGVHAWKLTKLREQGAIEEVAGCVPALASTHGHLYHHRFGLVLGGSLAAEPTDLIV